MVAYEQCLPSANFPLLVGLDPASVGMEVNSFTKGIDFHDELDIAVVGGAVILQEAGEIQWNLDNYCPGSATPCNEDFLIDPAAPGMTVGLLQAYNLASPGQRQTFYIGPSQLGHAAAVLAVKIMSNVSSSSDEAGIVADAYGYDASTTALAAALIARVVPINQDRTHYLQLFSISNAEDSVEVNFVKRFQWERSTELTSSQDLSMGIFNFGYIANSGGIGPVVIMTDYAESNDSANATFLYDLHKSAPRWLVNDGVNQIKSTLAHKLRLTGSYVMEDLQNVVLYGSVLRTSLKDSPFAVIVKVEYGGVTVGDVIEIQNDFLYQENTPDYIGAASLAKGSEHIQEPLVLLRGRMRENSASVVIDVVQKFASNGAYSYRSHQIGAVGNPSTNIAALCIACHQDQCIVPTKRADAIYILYTMTNLLNADVNTITLIPLTMNRNNIENQFGSAAFYYSVKNAQLSGLIAWQGAETIYETSPSSFQVVTFGTNSQVATVVSTRPEDCLQIMAAVVSMSYTFIHQSPPAYSQSHGLTFAWSDSQISPAMAPSTIDPHWFLDTSSVLSAQARQLKTPWFDCEIFISKPPAAKFFFGRGLEDTSFEEGGSATFSDLNGRRCVDQKIKSIKLAVSWPDGIQTDEQQERYGNDFDVCKADGYGNSRCKQYLIMQRVLDARYGDQPDVFTSYLPNDTPAFDGMTFSLVMILSTETATFTSQNWSISFYDTAASTYDPVFTDFPAQTTRVVEAGLSEQLELGEQVSALGIDKFDDALFYVDEQEVDPECASCPIQLFRDSAHTLSIEAPNEAIILQQGQSEVLTVVSIDDPDGGRSEETTTLYRVSHDVRFYLHSWKTLISNNLFMKVDFTTTVVTVDRVAEPEPEVVIPAQSNIVVTIPFDATEEELATIQSTGSTPSDSNQAATNPAGESGPLLPGGTDSTALDEDATQDGAEAEKKTEETVVEEATVVEGDGSGAGSMVEEEVQEADPSMVGSIEVSPEIAQEVQEYESHIAGKDVTKEQIQDAVAQVLEVENAEVVVAESQRVIDLEQEAIVPFNFTAFLERIDRLDHLGIYTETKGRSKAAMPPDFYIQQQLEEEFVLPFFAALRPDGSSEMTFSQKIKVLSSAELVALLKTQEQDEENGVGRRGLQSVQMVNDGDGQVTMMMDSQDLVAVTAVLKLSESIKCELIPSDPDDSFLDKKNFTWTVIEYQDDKMGVQFAFEHPEYISAGRKPDSMRVIFNHTEVFMIPKDASKLSAPDYLEYTRAIPPQSADCMSEHEVQTAQKQGQAYVFLNFILSFFYKTVLNMILGSIVVIQILAHFPLANIYLPANAFQQFDIMIGVVSFDYFQPTDYINLGFSRMPHWSPAFEWLGFETINFVEGMGSIILLLFFQLFYVLLTVCMHCKKWSCPCGWLRSKFLTKYVVRSSLLFIHGTFFEMLVCVSISMKMLLYMTYLNGSDQVSVGLAFLTGLVLFLYVALDVYFALLVAGIWVAKTKGDRALVLSAKADKVHEDIISRYDTLKTSNSTKSKEEMCLILSRLQTQRSKLTVQTKNIDETKFSKFEPLVEGLRHDSKAAMFSNFLINLRRLTLLYMAMFAGDEAWLHVLVFMNLNLLSLSFVLGSKPYTEATSNYLNAVNEVVAVLISYFISTVNDHRYDPSTKTTIGQFIVYILYFAWICNCLVFGAITASRLYRKIKSEFRRSKAKKQRAKSPPLTEETKLAEHDSVKRHRNESRKSTQQQQNGPDQELAIIQEVAHHQEVEVGSSGNMSQRPLNQDPCFMSENEDSQRQPKDSIQVSSLSDSVARQQRIDQAPHFGDNIPSPGHKNLPNACQAGQVSALKYLSEAAQVESIQLDPFQMVASIQNLDFAGQNNMMTLRKTDEPAYQIQEEDNSGRRQDFLSPQGPPEPQPNRRSSSVQVQRPAASNVSSGEASEAVKSAKKGELTRKEKQARLKVVMKSGYVSDIE